MVKWNTETTCPNKTFYVLNVWINKHYFPSMVSRNAPSEYKSPKCTKQLITACDVIMRPPTENSCYFSVVDKLVKMGWSFGASVKITPINKSLSNCRLRRILQQPSLSKTKQKFVNGLFRRAIVGSL